MNSDGVRYADFVRGLTPVYWRVYLDIGVRYGAWIATVAIVCAAQAHGVTPFVLVPLAALLIALFNPAVHIHEASHWNIAPDRDRNDLLCNVLMSWIIGLEIKLYRKVHFDHHRHLGTVRDTERSYFSALNATFILKGLTGFSAAQTLSGLCQKQRKRSARPKSKTRHAATRVCSDRRFGQRCDHSRINRAGSLVLWTDRSIGRMVDRHRHHGSAGWQRSASP